MPFGKRLFQLRTSSNFTQRDLSRKTGIDREYISRLENGHLPNPTISMVGKIAQGFNMNMSELLEGVLVGEL